MKNIDYISQLVYQMLCEDLRARDDDVYLYIKVCKHFNADALDKPFGQVLSCLKGYNLPPFETVRRTRQRNQELHPELSASEEVKKLRDKGRKKYTEYARQDVL